MHVDPYIADKIKIQVDSQKADEKKVVVKYCDFKIYEYGYENNLKIISKLAATLYVNLSFNFFEIWEHSD